MIHHIPTDQILETAIARDRLSIHDEPLEELKHSILKNGLRQPVEVYEIDGPTPYGLLSGARRLKAYRALADYVPDDRFATIPAFIREPGSLAQALAAMVEENEIRENISPFERGLIAARTVEAGVFDTLDAAITTLYAHASAAKRSRIRSLALVAERLEGVLKFPEALTIAQATRLASAIRQDFGDVIESALISAKPGGPKAEWTTLLPFLEEADRALSDTTEPRRGRPRRLARIRSGLTIRREMTRHGYILKFTGHEATSDFIDEVIDEIERWYGR